MIIDGKLLSGMMIPGQTINLGLAYTGNQLVVRGADGNDLSLTNPGYACVTDVTAGQTKVFTFTSNVTINDATHGTPQILGRLGTTASVAWGSAMPIFIGIVLKDTDTPKFCITRCPLPCFDSGANTNIGKSGTAAATPAQGNIIIMDSGVTVADYANKPVTTLGSFKMTIDNSAGGRGTVTALSVAADGFGKFQEGIKFTYPAGQNGNVANYYWRSDASADIPTYATPASIVAFYFIDRNGFVDYTMTTTGAGNCTQDPGAGAVGVVFELPYAFSGKETTSFTTYVTSRIRINNVNSLMSLGGTLTEGLTGVSASFMSDSVANTALQEDNWGDNANDDVSFRFSYSAF